MDVNEKSNAVKYSLATPFTFFEWMRLVLSQTNGTAGACAVIILSMSAQALLRASPSVSAALSIAASIFGSLSWARLLLPPSGEKFEPLNVGSSIDCGSLKSLNQPAEPQTATFFFGCWHHSVYTAAGALLLRLLAPLRVHRVLRHRAEADLEAELLELGLGDLGLGLARVDVRGDHEELVAAVVLA